jgi:hypothetical protein
MRVNKRVLLLAVLLAPSLVLLGAALYEIREGRDRWRRIRERIALLGQREDLGDGY